jgi:hypothetical protein
MLSPDKKTKSQAQIFRKRAEESVTLVDSVYLIGLNSECMERAANRQDLSTCQRDTEALLCKEEP